MSCDVIYEELAAYAAGELDAARAAEIGEHLPACEVCRRRLEALAAADAALTRMRPEPPSPEAVLAARRALADAVRRPAAPDVMALDEVAEFLRLTPDELEDVAEDLPAFELGGKVRVRRERLLEWIEQREREYARESMESWAARAAAGHLPRGVL